MIKEVYELTEEFRSRFPASEGWTVSAGWPRPDLPSMTNTLHIFLEDTASPWLIKKAYTAAGRVSFKPYDSAEARLPDEKIECSVNRNGWTGEMELNIEGEPLIIRNYMMPIERGCKIFTLQAYKDKEIIKKLFTAMLKWEMAKAPWVSKIAVCNSRSVTYEVRPETLWDDIILPDGMGADIRNNVEGFFKSGDLYKDIGIAYKRGFLLAGPPGNGKTMLARVLASDKNYNFCWLKLTSKTDDDTVTMAFRYAYHHAPSILLIEDLERLTRDNGITMSNILNQLDGLESRQGVLVIATTNAPEKLDPALVHRPSRFDRVWRLPLPSEEQRRLLLIRRGSKFFSPELIASVAGNTNGFSMAYTQEILSNALILAANEGVKPGDRHLTMSLAQIKSQYKNTFAREGLGREEDRTPHLGFTSTIP